jgi:hypothetical protein
LVNLPKSEGRDTNARREAAQHTVLRGGRRAHEGLPEVPKQILWPERRTTHRARSMHERLRRFDRHFFARLFARQSTDCASSASTARRAFAVSGLEAKHGGTRRSGCRMRSQRDGRRSAALRNHTISVKQGKGAARSGLLRKPKGTKGPLERGAWPPPQRETVPHAVVRHQSRACRSPGSAPPGKAAFERQSGVGPTLRDLWRHAAHLVPVASLYPAPARKSFLVATCTSHSRGAVAPHPPPGAFARGRACVEGVVARGHTNSRLRVFQEGDRAARRITSCRESDRGHRGPA